MVDKQEKKRQPTWQEILSRARDIATARGVAWPKTVVEAWLQQAHAELELAEEKKRLDRLGAEVQLGKRRGPSMTATMKPCIGLIKERPVSFSTELIPLILRGEKTQTRRTRGLDKINECPDDWKCYKSVDGRSVFNRPGIYYELRCPYGIEGERLWLRETYWCDDPARAQDIMSRYSGLYWKATEEHPEIFPRWKPGRFMPKWATRPERLEILRAWPERLQDISEGDARAEGMIRVVHGVVLTSMSMTPQGVEAMGEVAQETTRVQAFTELWDKLNFERHPWKDNPWVWVVEFKLVGAGGEGMQ